MKWTQFWKWIFLLGMTVANEEVNGPYLESVGELRIQHDYVHVVASLNVSVVSRSFHGLSSSLNGVLNVGDDTNFGKEMRRRFLAEEAKLVTLGNRLRALIGELADWRKVTVSRNIS